jgi:hypothetical protein
MLHFCLGQILLIRKKMEYEIRDSAVSLPKGLKEREQRLTKMMLIIFTVFIITYMPSYFVKTVKALMRPQSLPHMGVRRLFSRGGGARTYFLPEKQQKRYHFSQKKVEKHTIFGRPWPARGARAPLALPCGRPCCHNNLRAWSVIKAPQIR